MGCVIHSYFFIYDEQGRVAVCSQYSEMPLQLNIWRLSQNLWWHK